MGMKSGMRAAQRQGVPTASMRMGPKGGKFYFNSQGHKVYGTPPAPHVHVEAAKAAPKERAAVPSHVVKGATIHADLEGEGWVKGTVTGISKARGVARIRLHDGSGDIEAPFENTKEHHEPTPKPAKQPKPVPPPKAPKPPKDTGPAGGHGPHITMGHHVEVDLKGEGWIRGHISEIKGKYVHVELVDGTTAKAHVDTVRPAKEKPAGAERERVGINKYVRGNINGNPMFKYQISKAIEEAGFAPFLEKHPLGDMNEGGRGVGGRAMGVYARTMRPFSGETIHTEINLKKDMSSALGSIRAQTTDAVVGLGVFNVNTVSGRHMTEDDLYHSVIIHEISHHLHLHDNLDQGGRGTPADRDWDARVHSHHWKGKAQGSWVPSIYARTNHKEWFAEAHTAYVLHNKEFKENDPVGYALVRERRVMKGMKP